MIVMLLGGLWHGASWNFIIWGGIHGVMLAFERAQGKDSLYRRLPHSLRVVLTFGIVCISWVFFRAATLPAAERYIMALFGMGGEQATVTEVLRGVMYTPYHLIMLVITALVVWTAPQTWQFTRSLTWPRIAFCYGLLLVSVMLMWTQTSNPFLYFQF
jgi:alginate O-acetyltransferase complex protein AlgI